MRWFILILSMALPAAAQEAPGPFASFDLASAQVLGDPHDLTVGPDGRLYVADKLNARIAVFDPETLELVEEMNAGLMPQVRDISFGPGGAVAVAVTGMGAVAVFPNLVSLPFPAAMGVGAPGTEGALYHSNGRIYAMASGIGVLAMFENMDFVTGVEGHLGAHDVAEGADGSVWVADTRARALVRYTPELERIQVIDHPRFGFVGPRYMDVTETGLLVVTDQESHRVLLIDPEGPDGGTLLGVIGDGLPGLGPGRFDDPEGVAVDGNRYFISDSDNNRVVRYTVVLN